MRSGKTNNEMTINGEKYLLDLPGDFLKSKFNACLGGEDNTYVFEFPVN